MNLVFIFFLKIQVVIFGILYKSNILVKYDYISLQYKSAFKERKLSALANNWTSPYFSR